MKLINIIPFICSVYLICGPAYANKIEIVNPPAQFIQDKLYYANEYHPKLKICTQTDLSHDQSVSVSFAIGTSNYSFTFLSQPGRYPCTSWFERKATVDKNLEIMAELHDGEGTLLTPRDQLKHSLTNWNAPEECLIMNVNPSSFSETNQTQTITFEETTGC